MPVDAVRRALARVAFVGILALAAAPLEAQGPPGARPPAAPGEIRGRVVDDESQTGLASATVEVWAAADTSLVAGTLAGPDGGFRIEGLRPGVYRLRITMLGYDNHSTGDLAITPAAPVAAAGVLRLRTRPIELEGVVAEADRTVVIAPDRNAYRARDVAPAATSASDVLENVPSVVVDADGKVSLRGNENVVVQVNGRPSPVRGAQLAAYLKQLPANTIERIEVIPNPSARQDPEGMAGIINIVMKQGVDLGTSGGLTLAASTADRYSVAGNMGHQSGPIALAASYGFYDETRQVLGINDRTRLLSGVPQSTTEQDLDGENGFGGHNLNLNADFTLNPRDVLSLTFNGNRRGNTDATLTAYQLLDGAGTPTDQYDRFRDQESNYWLADAGLSFKHTFTPQKHELTAELRANRADDDERAENWRVGTDSERLEIEAQDVDAVTDQLSGQVDYVRTLGEAVKLETGYKGNGRWLERDFELLTDSAGTGTWVRSDVSNRLGFDEIIHAGYGVLSRSGTHFDVQAGVRVEHVDRDVTLRDTQESFPHSYNSVYPSGIVTWKANDATQLKLSYSRRVRRPGTFELNPFPNFFDVQNVLIGNPNLDPEYTDAVELSYMRSKNSASLQVTPFFRRTDNVINLDINTADTIFGREVTAVRFRNLDHSTSWGADVNGQLRLGPIGNALAAFNVARVVSDGGSITALSSDAIAWSVRLNATYNVRPSTALIAGWFYRGPMQMGRDSRFNSMAFANVAVRQTFLDDKAALVLRLSDPLRSMKFSVRAQDENVIQLTDREFNSRALHITLQYNTGQAPRLRQRRQEEQPQSANPFGG